MIHSVHKYSTQESLNLSLGQGSTTNIDNTATFTAAGEGLQSWYALYVLEDCVFEAITDTSATPNSAALVTAIHGDVIWGIFTSIKLTSGLLRAHGI